MVMITSNKGSVAGAVIRTDEIAKALKRTDFGRLGPLGRPIA
ncbi:MAG: hypothetical protein ABI330_02615 [Caldimonas sp.]